VRSGRLRAVTTLRLTARDLGARGSRGDVAGPDPAGPTSAYAASVLAAALPWWEARARDAGLSGEWLDATYAVETPAPSAALTAIPAEISANLSPERLGAAYVGALSSEVRARHGRHYTPSDLSEHLWRMAREALRMPVRATRLPGLVRDRASGAGALLLPPLREHVTASARTDPGKTLAGLSSVIEGSDADPHAVWLANVVLAAETLPLLACVPESRRRPFASLVTCADGLTTGRRPALVELQNPPYARVRLSLEERERWAHVLYGHANLYGLFIGAALEDLAESGVLAALVPTSFTSGLYFSKLRETLSKTAPLRSTMFVAERDGVFANVLQETCLTVFSRRRSRTTTIASVNGHVEQVARVKSPRGAGPWLLPRRADDAPTAASAARLPLRLADVGYRCSTGPLVWNRRAADLSAKPSPDAVPVVWAADIEGGRLHRDAGRDRLRYLRLSGSDEDVLVLDRPAVLVQRTTAPEQTRRLVLAHVSAEDLEAWGGRVVVENHVNVLRPATNDPTLTGETLAAVLSTLTMDRVMRSLSGSVAVSAYEIESIPFPDADVLATWNDHDPTTLDRAVAFAYRIG
jgi:adenine-specific DNA-methyltransferase